MFFFNLNLFASANLPVSPNFQGKIFFNADMHLIHHENTTNIQKHNKI